MSDGKKKRTRGRPRCFDRDEAVETALTMFRKNGYDGVSVAELSNALGINPPSFYAAFGSKHGLFEEAVEKYVSSESMLFARAVERAATLEEAIGNFLITAAETFTDQQDQCGCLVLDGTRNCTDAEARATTEAMRLKTRSFLQDVYSRYKGDNVEMLVEYTIIGLIGLSGAARQGMSRKTLVSAARRFAAAIAMEEKSVR